MSQFHNMHSRREFVKTALTAGAGALLPAVDAGGQDRRQGRIDVHHQCRTAVQGGAGRGPGSDWSPEKSIEQMDKFGIATSIISATVPAEPFYDGTEKSQMPLPPPPVVTETEPVPVPLPMVLPVTVPMFTAPAGT